MLTRAAFPALTGVPCRCCCGLSDYAKLPRDITTSRATGEFSSPARPHVPLCDGQLLTEERQRGAVGGLWHFCEIVIGRADVRSWGKSGPTIRRGLRLLAR